MRTKIKLEGAHHAALKSEKGQARAQALLKTARKVGAQTLETWETDNLFLLTINNKVKAIIIKEEIMEGEIGSPVSLTLKVDEGAWEYGRRPARKVA